MFLTLPRRPNIKGVKIAYKHFICKIDIPHPFNFIDPRGCGRSESNGSEDYQIETYIDDVEALRQHFGIAEHFVLVGLSYGSMAAQGYAIKYNKMLSALILFTGAPSYEFFDSAWKKLRLKGTPEQVAMFQKLYDGEITTDEGMKTYFQTMATMYFEMARHSPEAFKAYQETRKSARYHTPAVLAGFGKEGFLKSFDWRQNLHKITCPTLIMGGAEDWINTPDQWQLMHENISCSELHIIPNASHLIFIDQQKPCFNILSAFLKRIGSNLT